MKDDKDDMQKIRKIFEILSPKWDIWHIAAYAIVCWLLFTPYRGAFFPGIVEIDTSFQIAMSMGYGYGTIENYACPFPVFDIRLIGLIYSLGESFFGIGQTGGIKALCWFQCAGMSVVLSLAACYMSKWKIHPVARLATFLIVALVPIVPIMAVDIGKDTIFLIFFIPFFLCLCELVRKTFMIGDDERSEERGEKHERHLSWFLIIASVITAVLSSLAVSKGFVIIIVCLAANVLYAWKTKLRSVARDGSVIICGVIACQLVCSLALLPVMAQGLPGGSSFWRESMGTLVQQTTWVAKVSGDIEQKDWDHLYRFYDVESAVIDYIPDTSDHTKYWVHKDVGAKDALWFLDAYVSIGLSHPKEYLKSFIDLYDGFWQVGTPDSLMLPRFMNTGEDEYDTLEWTSDFTIPGTIDDEILALERGGLGYSAGALGEYAPLHPDFGHWEITKGDETDGEILRFVMEWGKIPVLNLLVSKSFYVLYLPLALLAFALIGSKKGYRTRMFLLLLPLGLTCIFAFLSPVDFTRYAYPSMMLDMLLVPLVIGAVVWQHKQTKVGKEIPQILE